MTSQPQIKIIFFGQGTHLKETTQISEGGATTTTRVSLTDKTLSNFTDCVFNLQPRSQLCEAALRQGYIFTPAR